MFPASFFNNIKNKIVPDIMETIFKLRSELEHKIDELKLELKAVKDITTDMGKDQHPPAINLEEWEDVKATIKKIKNKKVYKSLNAKK